MIHSGLETLNGTLSTNTYTRSTYNTAKELSSSAYKLTEPLQIRLAPLIVQADTYANKAVDAVESRYPYPFKAKPEEVVDYVRERRQGASDYANKTLDERIKSPALTVAHDLDQRLAPLVDYFETTVSRLNQSEAGPSNPDAQYQYQRALALSKTLKDNVYEYTTEQLKHIQAQSVIVQRASETAQSINALASSSFTSAQSRVHNLSENMVAELQKLQAQTQSLSSSIQSSIEASKSQIQTQLGPQIQQTYAEISTVLSHTIADFNEILKKKDTPLPEKVGLVGKEVRERVSPLLETIKKGLTEVLARAKGSTPPTPTSTSEEAPPSENTGEPTEEPTDSSAEEK
ncbi:hypothetical protein H1R20_g5374, partial [Candolleomyces eurysporus]